MPNSAPNFGPRDRTVFDQSEGDLLSRAQGQRFVWRTLTSIGWFRLVPILMIGTVHRPMELAVPRKVKRGEPAHIVNQALRHGLAHLAAVDMHLDSRRRVYNACLGESPDRCKRMRADGAFDAAKALSNWPSKSKEATVRNKAFNEVAATHGFGSDALWTFGSSLREAWVRDHVGAQGVQRLATRAFGASEGWSLDERARPRFENVSRGLRSLQCSDTYGDMQAFFDDVPLVAVRWSKTVIPVEALLENPTSCHDREVADERAWLESLIAAGGVIKTRIIRTIVRAQATLQVQFVLDGRVPIRHSTGTGTIGLDCGASAISVVVADAESNAVPEAIEHLVLAEGIKDAQADLRHLQRNLESQHIAGSRACSDETRVMPGPRGRRSGGSAPQGRAVHGARYLSSCPLGDQPWRNQVDS